MKDVCSNPFPAMICSKVWQSGRTGEQRIDAAGANSQNICLNQPITLILKT